MSEVFFVPMVVGLFLFFIGLFGLVFSQKSHSVKIGDDPTEIRINKESYNDPVDISGGIPSHEELIGLLNDGIKRRGSCRWKVFNTAHYKSDPDSWMAIADNGKDYIEDGRLDYWLVSDQKTMDEAMLKLLKWLAQPPNWKPSHRDDRERKRYEGISSECKK